MLYADVASDTGAPPVPFQVKLAVADRLHSETSVMTAAHHLRKMTAMREVKQLGGEECEPCDLLRLLADNKEVLATTLQTVLLKGEYYLPFMLILNGRKLAGKDRTRRLQAAMPKKSSYNADADQFQNHIVGLTEERDAATQQGQVYLSQKESAEKELDRLKSKMSLMQLKLSEKEVAYQNVRRISDSLDRQFKLLQRDHLNLQRNYHIKVREFDNHMEHTFKPLQDELLRKDETIANLKRMLSACADRAVERGVAAACESESQSQSSDSSASSAPHPFS